MLTKIYRDNGVVIGFLNGNALIIQTREDILKMLCDMEYGDLFIVKMPV